MDKKPASSRTEANRNSLKSFCCISPSSCYTLNSLFTIPTQQQALKTKQRAHLDTTNSTFRLKYPSQDLRDCGTSCLHLFNIISNCVLLLFTFNFIHSHSSHPLKLTCNFISLMFQHAIISTFPGNLVSSSTNMHHRQQRAVESHLQVYISLRSSLLLLQSGLTDS